jgi:hypothetical protein
MDLEGASNRDDGIVSFVGGSCCMGISMEVMVFACSVDDLGKGSLSILFALD